MKNKFEIIKIKGRTDDSTAYMLSGKPVNDVIGLFTGYRGIQNLIRHMFSSYVLYIIH
jgi:hypothetical protein